MAGRHRRVVFNDKEYALDEHGYLESPEQWDEDFPKGMAKEVGIYTELTDEHWRFIRYLRKKFVEDTALPFIVPACIDNNLRISMFKKLFPFGYMRGACRLAGINYSFLVTHNHLLTYENYSTFAQQFPATDTGFLNDFKSWDKRFAAFVASDWNLPEGLTTKHYAIIDYLRKMYEERQNIPTVYETCKANGIDLDEMQQLFPEGYRRGACRAAGLPFMP